MSAPNTNKPTSTDKSATNQSQAIELTSAQEKEFQKQWDTLSFGCFEIVPEEDFKRMLRKSIATGTPLRVKCGIDPTGRDVHLGHTIPYRKMRQFQEFGHTGVVIIGDYTAQIGDPTGANESRPALDTETVNKNAETFFQQVGSVLIEKRTEIRKQSEWFKEVNLRDVMTWAANTTVAKLLSHETFKLRLENEQGLGLHELFYPVLQGVDSVYVKADVELGGSDQKFNVLMGRDYQRAQGLRPQCAMLLPIIRGTCGQQKMSKSLGNYIGVLDEPFDKFGKVMSIPDDLMDEFAHYATGWTETVYLDFMNQLKSEKLHPNEAKKQIASRIVSLFHGDQSGKEMRDQFERVFAKKKLPDDLPECQGWQGKTILDVLVENKIVASKGEGRRMFKQNAVSIVDGDKIQNDQLVLEDKIQGKVVKVGKRKFLKLS